MSSRKRLHEMLTHFSESNRIDRHGVLRLLPLARELIEEQKIEAQYQKIKFFGDWSVHPKLERKSAKQLLDEVGKIIYATKDGPPEAIIRGISKALSISDLREELLTLFADYNLPVFLFELPSPWRDCATWLLQDLLEKPIVGSQFSEAEKATGWGTTPKALRLTAADAPGSPIKWCVDLGPRVELRGPLI